MDIIFRHFCFVTAMTAQYMTLSVCVSHGMYGSTTTEKRQRKDRDKDRDNFKTGTISNKNQTVNPDEKDHKLSDPV